MLRFSPQQTQRDYNQSVTLCGGGTVGFFATVISEYITAVISWSFLITHLKVNIEIQLWKYERYTSLFSEDESGNKDKYSFLEAWDHQRHKHSSHGDCIMNLTGIHTFQLSFNILLYIVMGKIYFHKSMRRSLWIQKSDRNPDTLVWPTRPLFIHGYSLCEMDLVPFTTITKYSEPFVKRQGWALYDDSCMSIQEPPFKTAQMSAGLLITPWINRFLLQNQQWSSG